MRFIGKTKKLFISFLLLLTISSFSHLAFAEFLVLAYYDRVYRAGTGCGAEASRRAYSYFDGSCRNAGHNLGLYYPLTKIKSMKQSGTLWWKSCTIVIDVACAQGTYPPAPEDYPTEDTSSEDELLNCVANGGYVNEALSTCEGL